MSEKTLGLITVALTQKIHLRSGLHPLGDDLEIEIVGQRDDRLGNRRIVGILGNIANEGAIDLEAIDGETL